jgi:hypothetical protein
MLSRGITFVRAPKSESYGTVAVLKDLYGNLWDLLELKLAGPVAGQPHRALGEKPDHG